MAFVAFLVVFAFGIEIISPVVLAVGLTILGGVLLKAFEDNQKE